MKKRILTLLIVLIFSVLALSACEVFFEHNPPNEYTVTFETNGANAIDPVIVTRGGLITRPADPQRGYDIFDGWFTDAEFNNPWNFESDKVNEYITLYAKWIDHVHEGGEATCTAKAICSVCSEEYGDTLEHVIVKDDAVDPTCTTTGLTEGAHCDVCGTVIKAQETIPTISHTIEIITGVESTCTVAGLTEGKKCSVCGEVLVAQEAAPLKAHTEEILPEVKPTCTVTGLTEGKKCSVCGEILVAQEEVAALGHTVVVDAAVAPTCTETGLTEGSHCSVCGEVFVAQTEVAALGHTVVVDEAVAPTCTETGLTEGSHCSVCGEVFVAQIVVPATGHTESDPVIENVVPSSCTSEGSFDLVVKCSVCGDDLSRETVTTAVAPHTEVVDAAVAPTCTATGLTEGSHCSVCGEVFVAQEVVDALGHKDTDPRDHECDVCGLSTTDCIDENKNHKCDICGDKMGDCADDDHNHFCDWCGVQNSHCINLDPTLDHTCDWCGERTDDCVDVDPRDHECDVCGLSTTDCIDENKNHKCDICGDKMGDCADDDHNHFCDWCGVQNSHCINLDPTIDHTCDWCGERTDDCVGGDVVVENEVEADYGVAGSYDNVVYCTVCGEEVSRETVTVPALKHPLTLYYYTTSWKNVNLYAWIVDPVSAGWPGSAMTAVEGKDGWFTITLELDTLEGLKVIFNNGSAQTLDLEYTGLNYWVGDTAYATLEEAEEAIKNAEPPKFVTLYLKPNSNWKQSNARYAAYTWDGGDQWFDFTKSDVDGIWEVQIPVGISNIIFCRMNPSATANNWNNKWNQTSDLKVPTNGTNCYEVKAGTWDKGGGTWTTHTPTVHEHTYTENVTAPTCETAGYTTYTCSCGDTYKGNDVAALGHDYSTEWTVDVPATCTEAGSKSHHCSRCDSKSDVTEITAIGHRYGNLVVHSASCTVDGYIEITCGNCNVTFDSREDDEAKQYLIDFPFINVTAKGHNEVTDEAVAPDCVNTGLTKGSHCSACNEVFVAQEEVPALGHDYESVVTAPTCTSAGYTTHTCKVCSDSYTDNEVEALGHDYDEVVTAPTCTTEGYTTYTCACGDSYVGDETDALGHTEVTVPGQDATCTEEGLSEGKKCSVCETVLVAQTVVSALGHKHTNDSVICDNCGLEKQSVWTLVTNVSQLTAGSKVVIVASGSNYAMSTTQNTNNRGQAAVTKSSDKSSVTFGSDVQILTVQNGKNTGTYALHTGSGYIYAAGGTGSNNYLRTSTSLTVTSSWTISITSAGVATIKTADSTVARNTLFYNNTSSLFSCYASGQQSVGLYILSEQYVEHVHTEKTVSAVAPTCENTGLTEGKVCSVCGETLVAQTEVPATGHNYVIDEAVDPTCENTGLTEGTHCANNCGIGTVAQVEVPVIECNFVNGVCTMCGVAESHVCTPAEAVKENNVDPTCTANGSYDMVVYCEGCGDKLSTEHFDVEATGHNFEDGACTKCGEADPDAAPVAVLTLTASDFTNKSYADNNKTHTKNGYSYTSYQVMKQSYMQWQKSKGYITFVNPGFKKLELVSTAGTFTVTVGGKTVKGTSASGITTYDFTGLTGEVKITVGSATGQVTSITLYK